MVALQVVLGLVIIFCVYKMSLWLLRKDRLVVDDINDKDPKEMTKIVDGYVFTTLAANRSWSTLNPEAMNFVKLPRSYNRKGGAQFTYSFWLYMDDTSSENVANKDILLRGDNRVYTFQKVTDYDDGMIRDTIKQDVTDVLIKSPRIRFGPTYDSFVVELNTLHNPDEKIFISPMSSSDDATLRHNVLKLMQHRWAMFTFTFEDNVAINDFEDGILVRFYVNDLLYGTYTIRSTLRQNRGDFYLMQTSGDMGIKNGRIGDVYHYNYAISHAMVRDMFKKGHPKYPCTDLMGDSSMGTPLYLSEYNKLDMYNT